MLGLPEASRPPRLEEAFSDLSSCPGRSSDDMCRSCCIPCLTIKYHGIRSNTLFKKVWPVMFIMLCCPLWRRSTSVLQVPAHPAERSRLQLHQRARGARSRTVCRPQPRGLCLPEEVRERGEEVRGDGEETQVHSEGGHSRRHSGQRARWVVLLDFGTVLDTWKNCDAFLSEDNPSAPAPREMTELETSLAHLERDLSDVNNNYVALRKNQLELLELKNLLLKTEHFLSETSFQITEGSGTRDEESRSKNNFALHGVEEKK